MHVDVYVAVGAYIYGTSQFPNVEEPVTWSHGVCCLLCDQVINQAYHMHHTASLLLTFFLPACVATLPLTHTPPIAEDIHCKLYCMY